VVFGLRQDLDYKKYRYSVIFTWHDCYDYSVRRYGYL